MPICELGRGVWPEIERIDSYFSQSVRSHSGHTPAAPSDSLATARSPASRARRRLRPDLPPAAPRTTASAAARAPAGTASSAAPAPRPPRPASATWPRSAWERALALRHEARLEHEVRHTVEDRLAFVDLDALDRVDALRQEEVVSVVDGLMRELDFEVGREIVVRVSLEVVPVLMPVEVAGEEVGRLLAGSNLRQDLPEDPAGSCRSCAAPGRSISRNCVPNASSRFRSLCPPRWRAAAPSAQRSHRKAASAQSSS